MTWLQLVVYCFDLFLPNSSVKAVDKREGGGAHNWGKQDEAGVEEWPEDSEPRQDTQEPTANGEVAPENKWEHF